MADKGEKQSSERPAGQRMVTAGFQRRVLASIIDAFVASVPAVVVASLTMQKPPDWYYDYVGTLLWLFLLSGTLLGLALIYGTVMLGRFGWTLGMRALKVRVSGPEGSSIGYRRAALRSFAFVLPGMAQIPLTRVGWPIAASFLSAAFFVGLLWMIIDRQHQAYHDKIAGTFVVRGVKPVAEQAGAAVPTGRVITTPPSRLPLRLWKWAVFVVLSCLFLSPLVMEVAAYQEGKQVNHLLAQLKAAGIPTTRAALIPPPIPDAENAALVYEEASKAFKWNKEEEGIIVEVVSNWEWGYPLAHNISPEELAELKPPPTGDSLEAQVFALAKRAVEQNVEAFALLHKVATMEKWRSLRKDEYLLNSRRIAKGLGREAMVRSEEGDADAALRAATTTVCLLNSYDEPRLIVPLLRMISCSIGVRAVERVLFDSTPSAAACRAGEAALAKDKLRTSFLRGLEGTRVSFVEMFEKVRRSPHPAKEWAGFLPRLEYIQWKTPPGSSDYTPRQGEIQGRMFLLGGFVRWRTATEELYFLSYIDLCSRQMQFPPFEQDLQALTRLKKLEALPYDRGICQIWYPFLLPRLTNANRRLGDEETSVALARVALLLKAYRAERGSYPESLDQLEAYLGKQLPLDPCSGKPFHYRLEGRGFILYSVGPDGTDDGGDRPAGEGPIPPLSNLIGGKSKDIVWVCKE